MSEAARAPWSAPAGLLARLRALSLGVRLAVASALVTGLVVAAVFQTLRARVDADVRGMFAAQLLERQRDVGEVQRARLQLLLATSSLASTSPTLRAALDTRNFEMGGGQAARKALQETIDREVQRLYHDVGRDLLFVTDERGNVLAAAGRAGAPSAGESVASLPAVRSALSPESVSPARAYGVMIVDGAPVQIGCVPVLVNGYPVGALVVGERLDRLMPDAAAGGAAEVVVAGGLVVRSTLAALAPGAQLSTQGDSAMGASEVTIGADEFLSASVPLGLMASGQPAQLVLLHSLSAALRPLESELRRRFVLGGIAAVLLLAFCGAVVARTSLRPLDRFVQYLRIGATGVPFEAYHDPSPPAEIRTLTEAYNGMIEAVRHQQRQLEKRSVELAAANEGLRGEVRERERAEEALLQSEAQLRQSQKLEALGTLAGGVAHDFNNLLSVIMGYAQLVAADLENGSAMRVDVERISESAARARELVRQLLAFGRKQVLQPQLLEPNAIISRLHPLFAPLLGESVRVALQLDGDVNRIRADPTQLEQVLLNLVVNARDAMPDGGVVTIETRNVVLDERFENAPDVIAGGPAVMLSVRDTGIGMDSATRSRIFEPFFTTKAPGHGSGLGLATVYGIVKQSGGSITVYSAPCEGTTFRVYFPMAAGSGVHDAGRTPSVLDDTSGTETVLLVEDEMELRLLVRRVLEHRGYHVLEAADGRAALEIASGYLAPVHLLLTDVVLPQMSGTALAERMRAVRPELRVLFMSGYSGEVVERHGQLAADTEFLAKPVLPDALARAVRRTLDGLRLEAVDA